MLLPASAEGVLAVTIHFLNSKMHVFFFMALKQIWVLHLTCYFSALFICFWETLPSPHSLKMSLGSW